MKPTREILSKISNHTYSQITLYKFNTGVLQVSDKYREGRLTALQYTSELSLYYMNMEKEILSKFREQIDKQMQTFSCLEDNDYKDGIYDALNDVLDVYRKIEK